MRGGERREEKRWRDAEEKEEKEVNVEGGGGGRGGDGGLGGHSKSASEAFCRVFYGKL